MSYSGRKSGKAYTTPMNYLAVKENGREVLYTISKRERVWWRNLRGGADVSLRLRGHTVPARSQVIEDTETVAENLQAYFAAAPKIARYYGISVGDAGLIERSDLLDLAQDLVLVKTDPHI